MRVPHVFAASPLAFGDGLHVSRIFRVLQHHIKTEPEEESKVPPPEEPPQEPKVAEKPVEEAKEKEAGQLPDTASAGVAKSDAEMGQQPPEAAATAGEEKKDQIVQI